MNLFFKKYIFSGVILIITILLFSFVDYFIHSLENSWSVPEYYFKDKIIFGFLWGIVGLFIARKFNNIWLKALVFSSMISITLQVRYFIEGYDLNFVLLFLLIHFIILYLLSVVMFKFLKN